MGNAFEILADCHPGRNHEGTTVREHFSLAYSSLEIVFCSLQSDYSPVTVSWHRATVNWNASLFSQPR